MPDNSSVAPLAPTARPRIVLIGAGHAHLHVIRQRHRLASAELVVVEPSGFWYSGMASGMLGGRLPPAQDRLEPRRLVRRHDATLMRCRLVGLDRVTREILLDDGRRFGFSLLSLNLGSQVEPLTAHRNGPQAWSVKPIPQLVRLRRQLERSFAAGERSRVIVVGGGPSGVEIACNLVALARRHRADIHVTIITHGTTVLTQAPTAARHWLADHLERQEITVRPGTQALSHAAGGLTIADSADISQRSTTERIPADHVIHASGLQPPMVASQLGLPMVDDRGLAVLDTLQSTGDPDIFAVGDCAAMPDHPLPHQGVYGVRQGPVLLDNLAARLYGRRLRNYVPQRQALAILDLGEGQGLALRGRHWWAGRLTLLWKRWLDERFLRRHRC
ncbi:MAG: NAD(P)/FAD-dependent oxidoreductase [Pseudomonadota bacterium]